ncbi:hypothetical protein D3C81_2272800 [compost metagenome]
MGRKSGNLPVPRFDYNPCPVPGLGNIHRKKRTVHLLRKLHKRAQPLRFLPAEGLIPVLRGGYQLMTQEEQAVFMG